MAFARSEIACRVLVRTLCDNQAVRELAARQALGFGLATEVLSVDGFADAARARVADYVERRAGLAAMRGARNMDPATDSLGKQLEAVAPLMLENFGAPGVAARIQQYLGGLGKR
jgi:hypothetical protein